MSNEKNLPVLPMTVATGKEELTKELTALLNRFERGEITCAALRVYNKDGTWEDVVLGGASDEERRRALADLHHAQRAAH